MFPHILNSWGRMLSTFKLTFAYSVSFYNAGWARVQIFFFFLNIEGGLMKDFHSGVLGKVLNCE